jgi:hypothetical protein
LFVDEAAAPGRSRLAVGSLESQPGGGGHHRGASRVDGGGDLLGVDALQVDGGRAEVGVAELALEHVERHALAGELDGMRVAQLVRREPAPDAPEWRGGETRCGPRRLTTVARG